VKTNENQIVDPASRPTRPLISARMGDADAGSSDESSGGSGSESLDVADRHPPGQERASVEEPGNHLRKRRIAGISTPHDVAKIEEALLEAFKQGLPEEAFRLSRDLAELAYTAVKEAAKARFHSNFGSKACTSCEGLRAGPGVVATCVQVSLCYYTNFKEGDLTPKQARMLRVLG